MTGIEVWRAEAVGHRQAEGSPPYEWVRRRGEPLARRGEFAVHGADGEIRATGTEGRTLWTRTFAGRPNAAHVSGDRVLVTTDSLEYTPWGFLGPAYLLDLADGRLVAELRGERGAALGDGRFLLGLEGYGIFETRAYDRDGAETDRWPSYGHYVVGSGVRVVEADRRIPTRGRVVRLRPGGTVVPGPRLNDPQPPRPVVLPDGTLLVLDGGAIRAFGRDLGTTVLAELKPLTDTRTIRSLRWDGAALTATVAEPHPADPARYTVDTWTFRLSATGDGDSRPPAPRT
ncbi:hypothetical protein GCM10017562_23810 [Streptomyces roseofulvus]|uniref:Uncharacterized protein n=2 Tax=Streptomyces TaxID=1883 RepID=A0ABU4KIK5_9ACTN|nr:hypothetical protein [Streptomyces roseolus]MDX2297537.1 hypothetical protein [Streptomyces roseolus]